MLFRILKCEQMKLKKTWILLMSIIIPVAINILLTIDLQYRYTGFLLIHQAEMKLSCWQLIFKEQRVLYFSALLPLIVALVLNHIFSVESKNNGWSMILSQPIKKSKILISKYIISCKYIIILLLVNMITIIISGIITGVSDPLDISLFIRCFLILCSSTMAIAVIQMILLIVFSEKWVGIFAAFILGVFSQDTYLNNFFSKLNPYSFADYSFRADWNQALSMLFISVLFIISGLSISILIFNRKNFYR